MAHVPFEERPSPGVDLVVISHGHEALLPSCLEAARPALPTDAAVVVIDNLGRGRPDLPDDALAIANARPLGFAANANLGIGSVANPYVLLLNPDARIARGRIGDLIAFMEGRPEIACVGARLLDPDGTRQASARAFPDPWLLLQRAIGRGSRHVERSMGRDRDPEHPERVDWVMGAFMLLRRSALEAVGGFDERYRLYYEDVDLCHRLALAGHETWYHPGVVVEHDHARQSARNPFQRVFVWHLTGAIRFMLRRARARVGERLRSLPAPARKAVGASR